MRINTRMKVRVHSDKKDVPFELKEVKCKLLRLPKREWDKFVFALHRDVQDRDLWIVSEYSTGLSIMSKIETNDPKQARQIAIKNLFKIGIGKFTFLRKKEIEKYGIINKTTGIPDHNKNR